MEKNNHKEQNLYKNILNSLHNIFIDDYLKSMIISDKSFKDEIIQLLNTLLTLEKQFDCSYKEKNITIDFVRTLSNFTSERFVIEKLEKFDFDEADEKWILFINHFAKETHYEKSKIKADNDNDIDVEKMKASSKSFSKLNASKIISDYRKEHNLGEEEPKVVTGEVVDEADKKDAKSDESKSDESKSSSESHDQNQNTNGFNNNGNSDFFGKMGGAAGGFAGGMGMPIHPRMDPSFYPYKSKPKSTNWLKKLTAATVLLAALAMFIGILVSLISPVSIGMWTIDNPSTQYRGGIVVPYIGNNPPDLLKFYTDGNLNAVSRTFMYGFGFSGSFAWIELIMILISGFYLGYTMLRPPNKFKEKYVMSLTALVVNGLILFIVMTSFFQILSLNADDFTNLFYTENVQPDYNDAVNSTASQMVDIIKNSKGYAIFFPTAIISVTFGCIAIVVIIFAAFLNPRMDKSKLMMANNEFRKATESAMRGIKYTMPDNLFDKEAKAFNEKKLNQNSGEDS